MALGRSRRDHGGLNAWPGYVDALSTLLMVLIFVLLVFVLAQGFLSVALSSRDRALDRLNRQVAELGELLSLERGQAEELRGSLSRTAEELRTATAARDAAQRSLSLLRDERDRLAAERDTTRGERDRLAARIADLEAGTRGSASRVAELEQRLAEALARTEAVGTDAARTLADTQRQLTGERQQREAAVRDLATTRLALEEARRDLAAIREEAARLDRTVVADRETIEARLSDIAKLNDQVRALEALRDQLEKQAQGAIARAGDEERQRAEAQRAQAAAEALVGQANARAQEAERRRAEAENQSGEYARLSESARAQVALLTRQVDQLRSEIARLSAALDVAENEGKEKETQIANLGQRLNAALAARVEELQSYRSDFFGRLRRVLGDRPDVRIVGDRFVFQSEVLFPVGSAELTPAGAQQMRELAHVLLDLAKQFPPDLNWILRVDGHADRSPVRGGRFASNWELSAARAIAVAQLLIQEGLPANRVAAAAFGDTQPLDDRDTPDAYARNRRIELRLTDR